jgi:hypothetical protein
VHIFVFICCVLHVFDKPIRIKLTAEKDQEMAKFIELRVSDDDEAKTELVNIASIGRVYADPQSRMRSIVELNYQSVNDAPVYLEVDVPYESLKSTLLG